MKVRFMFFFFQAEDGIRDYKVTGVQTCALPICTELDRSHTPVSAVSDAGDALRAWRDLTAGRWRIDPGHGSDEDRKSTRLNSSHLVISYAVFCLKKKTSGAVQHQCHTVIHHVHG